MLRVCVCVCVEVGGGRKWENLKCVGGEQGGQEDPQCAKMGEKFRAKTLGENLLKTKPVRPNGNERVYFLFCIPCSGVNPTRGISDFPLMFSRLFPEQTNPRNS